MHVSADVLDNWSASKCDREESITRTMNAAASRADKKADKQSCMKTLEGPKGGEQNIRFQMPNT